MKYQINFCWFFGLVLCLLMGTAHAGKTKPRVLTLDAAIAQVLTGNPDIQSAHERTIAAQARIPQAKALEDPMIGVEFYNVPIDTINVGRSDDIDYKIKQNLPFPGKRITKGKTARFTAELETATAHGTMGDVILDLKKTYYDIYRLDRLLEINGSNQRLFKQLLGSAKTAFASGKTSAGATLQAQIGQTKLMNEAILLTQERITHMSHLKALLAGSSHETIILPAEFKAPRIDLSLNELKDIARTTRPELTMLSAMAKREQSRLVEARQTLIPDFQFGVAYKQKPVGQDVWSAEAMINLPIFAQKNRAAIREAKADLRATLATQESMLLHTEHDLDQAYANVLAMKKILTTYQSGILPQAKLNLASARTSYASGQSDFATLVSAAQTYKELNGSYYETQAGLGGAVAELERMIGRSLTKEEAL